MSPENRKFLEYNRHHWITLRDAFYLRMIDGPTRSRLVEIMREEFRPGYTADLWCATCCANMVKEVYYEFEQWERKQIPIPAPGEAVICPDPLAVITEAVEIVKTAVEISKIPDPEEKVKQIKANFPLNKRR